MIDPLAARQGELSQNLGPQQQHLAAADATAFNQTDDHPDVLDYPRAGRDGVPFGCGWFWPARGTLRPSRRRPWAGRSRRQTTAALIELFLNLFSLRLAVIGGAAPKGSAPARFGPATKRAPDLPQLVQVARVRQKENPAMPAPGQAGTQTRLGPQYRSQNKIVFPRQGSHMALAIPLRPILKMLCDPDCKSAKLWLRMLIVNLMSPSYPIDTPVSSK